MQEQTLPPTTETISPDMEEVRNHPIIAPAEEPKVEEAKASKAARALKIVIHFEETKPALVGISADGCDPFFATVPSDLTAIAVQLRSMVDAAEEQWGKRKKNPAYVKPKEATPAKKDDKKPAPAPAAKAKPTVKRPEKKPAPPAAAPKPAAAKPSPTVKRPPQKPAAKPAIKPAAPPKPPAVAQPAATNMPEKMPTAAPVGKTTTPVVKPAPPKPPEAEPIAPVKQKLARQPTMFEFLEDKP